MKHLLLTTIAAVLLVGSAFADPIHDAAKGGDLAGVQAELDKGAEVNGKDDGGWTTLHWAAWHDRKEIVELLIAKGADVNAKTDNQYGDTPLHKAAWGGQKEMAELLISKGADVNAKSNGGATPLHYTTWRGHKEIVELLISKGADVSAKSNGGATPLHMAANQGEKEIAELLIAKGADVNTKTDDGDTPLDLAAKREIADLLRKHGGKTGEELAMMPRLVQNGRFAFSFDAKNGKVYEVQDSFDLLHWEVIKTYTGTGSSVRFDEERDHDPPKWFYRVRVVE